MLGFQEYYYSLCTLSRQRKHIKLITFEITTIFVFISSFTVRIYEFHIFISKLLSFHLKLSFIFNGKF